MATIGQALATPEAGWIRYDDTDSRILYTGTVWSILNNNSSYWNKTVHYIELKGATSYVQFKFKGSNIRIIGASDSTNPLISVSIDSVNKGNLVTGTTGGYIQLLYEATNLSNSIHTIQITIPGNAKFYFDAIDVDSTGYLVHPILNQVSDISQMKVGDCIPCKWVASTSGTAGAPSQLGDPTIASTIPITGSATPNGLFYFIKTDKGLAIADRVVQTNITPTTLTNSGYIDGTDCIIKATTYTGEALPESSGFTITKGTINSYSVVNGILNYKIDAGANIYWTATTPAAVTTGLRIFEFRAKVSGAMDGWNSPFLCALANSTNRLCVRLAQDGIYIGTTVKKSCVLNDKMHTIRVILDASNTFNIYLDDNHQPILSGDSSLLDTANLNTIMFGGFQCGNVDVSLDYVYFGTIGFVNRFNSYIMRSLDGGIAYSDASGNKSLTDQSKGGWPLNNEWDKYIMKSDLNGVITPGDNNIWNANHAAGQPLTSCKSVVLNNVVHPSSGTYLGTSSMRVWRGIAPSWQFGFTDTTANAADLGLRPVLQYVEYDNSNKQINAWY